MAYFNANGIIFCVTIENNKITAIGKELDVNFSKELEESIKLEEIKSISFRHKNYMKLLVEYQTQSGIKLLELEQVLYNGELTQPYINAIKRKIAELFDKNIVSGDEFDELITKYEKVVTNQNNRIEEYIRQVPRCVSKPESMTFKEMQDRINDMTETLNILEMEQAELIDTNEKLKADIKKTMDIHAALDKISKLR